MSIFVRDPFEIAPDASRHPPASWLVLIVGLVFVAACGVVLDRSYRAVSQMESAAQARRDQLRAQMEREAAMRRRQSNPAALEKIQAQEKLQNVLRMSWSGLFDALEIAGRHVDGGTTVLVLNPKRAHADVAEVVLTVLAASEQIMLDYIRALEANPHVRAVQLTAQEPSVNAKVQNVRFQLSILWKVGGRPSEPMIGDIR